MDCKLSSTVSIKQLESWPCVLPALASVGVATVIYKWLRAQYASTTRLRRFFCSSLDRKSTRLNSSHVSISYAVFCLKKKKEVNTLIMVTEAKQCNLQKHTASPLDKVEREEPTISDTITHQPTQHTVVNI